MDPISFSFSFMFNHFCLSPIAISIERNQKNLMGNYKFKLSDMIPNSWFYKLKDMGFTSNRKNHSLVQAKKKNDQLPRKSHSFTRQTVSGQDSCEFPAEKFDFVPDPHRKSTKLQKPRRRSITRSSTPGRLVSSCGGDTTDCPPCRFPSPPSDILIEVESHEKELRNDDPIVLSQLSIEKQQKKNSTKKLSKPIELPPIITRPSPSKNEKSGSSTKEQKNSPSRKFMVNSQGPKLRINSPRVSSKRFSQTSRRKSVSSSKGSVTDSLAIVKSSKDPQRDFRESMVEMIVENKISGSNELEDLLACYLSLNTDEYHDIIIKVFKQIWFDMTDIGV